MIRRLVKAIGNYLIGVFNFNIPRKLNSSKIIVPVRSGVKVGITGEKWMSGILKKLFESQAGGFLDIGVNLGQTLIKVKSLDPKRDYIGFEPNPSCVCYLRQLISVNNWKNATIVPSGVFHTDGILELHGLNDTHGASTVIDDFKTDLSGDSSKSQFVPLLSLETIKKSISLNNISIIKVDVEGAELDVTESLLETIKYLRPVILLEVWHSNNDPKKMSRANKIMEILNSVDYKIFSWEKSKEDPFYSNLEETELGASKGDNYLLLPQESYLNIIEQL